MFNEIMDLLYTIGALIAGEPSQDHQNETVLSLFGRKCDGFSCWSRECEVRRLCTHRRGLGESGPAEEQRAGDGDNGSPDSTKVNCAGRLGSAGRKVKSGHNEALLLWTI